MTNGFHVKPNTSRTRRHGGPSKRARRRRNGNDLNELWRNRHLFTVSQRRLALKFPRAVQLRRRSQLRIGGVPVGCDPIIWWKEDIGSIIIVIATDAPLTNQLGGLPAGPGRTRRQFPGDGSEISHCFDRHPESTRRGCTIEDAGEPATQSIFWPPSATEEAEGTPWLQPKP
jgi:hypothetical protein